MTANPVRLSVPSLSRRDEPNPQSFTTSKPKTPSRRMTIDRAISSPPITPVSPGSQTTEFTGFNQPRTIKQELLTPPISPTGTNQSEFSSPLSPSKLNSVSRSLQFSQEKPSIDGFVLGSLSGPTTPPDEVPVLEYPYDLENVRDATGRVVEFGAGAWSTVYKCVSRPGSTRTEERVTSTPGPLKSLSPLVVAVKTPHRKDGQAILRSEAKILSHLARLAGAERRVIPFHGTIFETSSIVMSAVPLSLADHIETRRMEMRSMYKRAARGNPVVGSETVWLSLASTLIDSLQWMHDVAGVVHGDIKPQNILLRSTNTGFDCDTSYQLSNQTSSASSFPFTPLFADFSSSLLTNSLTRSPGALSAVTPHYTAPEFQTSKVLRDPNTLPTTAADVFSLATTLLVCATGDLNVYPSPMAMQRLAMAKQGWQVVQFAQSGSDGLRVPRGGLVERVLKESVRKIEAGRCDTKRWQAVVNDEVKRLKERTDEVPSIS